MHRWTDCTGEVHKSAREHVDQERATDCLLKWARINGGISHDLKGDVDGIMVEMANALERMGYHRQDVREGIVEFMARTRKEGDA